MEEITLKQQVAKLLKDCAKESAKHLAALREMPKYKIEKIKNAIPALNTQKQELYNKLIEKTFKADCFYKHAEFIVQLHKRYDNKNTIKTKVINYYNDLIDDLRSRQAAVITNKKFYGREEQKFNLTLPLDIANNQFLTITLSESDYLDYQVKYFAKCKALSIEKAEGLAKSAMKAAEETGLELYEITNKIKNYENEMAILKNQAESPETYALERALKEKFMHPIEMMLVYHEEEFSDFLNKNATDEFQKAYYERIARAKMFESRKTSWGVKPISNKTFAYLIEDIIDGKLVLPEIQETQNDDFSM